MCFSSSNTLMIGHFSRMLGPIDVKQKGSTLVHFWVWRWPLTSPVTLTSYFSRWNTIGHTSGMIGPIYVKRKGGESVEYWVNYVILTIDLTHDLHLGFFKVKCWNSCISGIVGLIDGKWKVNEMLDYMTLPFDHTDGLDFEVSRSTFEIAYLRNESVDLHGLNEMWVVHSWPWNWPLFTMMVCMDVPDSDWGDYRHQLAIDISSLVACATNVNFKLVCAITPHLLKLGSLRNAKHLHWDSYYFGSNLPWPSRSYKTLKSKFHLCPVPPLE